MAYEVERKKSLGDRIGEGLEGAAKAVEGGMNWNLRLEQAQQQKEQLAQQAEAHKLEMQQRQFQMYDYATATRADLDGGAYSSEDPLEYMMQNKERYERLEPILKSGVPFTDYANSVSKKAILFKPYTTEIDKSEAVIGNPMIKDFGKKQEAFKTAQMKIQEGIGKFANKENQDFFKAKMTRLQKVYDEAAKQYSEYDKALLEQTNRATKAANTEGNRTFDEEDKLRNRLTTGALGEQYKVYQTAKVVKKNIARFIANPSGYKDQATIMQASKVLQLDSTAVREAEARGFTDVASRLERFQNWFDREKDGDKMQPAQRKEVAELLTVLAEESEKSYKNAIKPVYNQAIERGLNTKNIFDAEFLQEQGGGQGQTEIISSPSGKKYEVDHVTKKVIREVK